MRALEYLLDKNKKYSIKVMHGYIVLLFKNRPVKGCYWLL